MCDAKLFDEANEKNKQEVRISDAAWMQSTGKSMIGTLSFDTTTTASTTHDVTKDALEVSRRIKTGILEAGECSQSASKNMENGNETDVPEFRPVFTQTIEHDTPLIPGIHTLNQVGSLESNSFAENRLLSKPNSICDAGNSNLSTTFGGGLLMKTGSCKSIGLFSSQSIGTEKTDHLQNVHNQCCSVQDLENSSNDLDSGRIYTTEDYVQGGCSKIPQSLLVTKGVQVYFLRESDRFGSATSVTGIDRNTTTVLHQPAPLPSRGRAAVEIHYLSSSSEDSRQGNEQDIKDPNSGTGSRRKSVESNQMETKFSENTSKLGGQLCGSCSTKLFKDIDLDLNLSPTIEDESSRDICDGRVPVQEPNSKSDTFTTSYIRDEPEKRWIKRLKVNQFTAQGTKIDETPPAEKMKSCRTSVFITNGSGTTASRKNNQPHVYHTKAVENNHNESVMSDAWIRRWLCSRTIVNTKESEAASVTSNPQRSNLTMESIKNSRYPSIAARALTGRVLLDFKSCRLQKKGSISVWYARAF